MRKILPLCLAFTLVLFSLCGCGVSSSESVSLSYGWSYSLVSGDFAPSVQSEPKEVLSFADSVNFIPLPDDQLALLETLLPEKEGEVWLKKTVYLPSSLKGQDLSLYLGRVSMADETWFNGSYIGGEGTFPPQEFSAWNDVRLYHIPGTAVNWEGENVILVRIRVNGEGSIVANPFIGATRQAKYAGLLEAFLNSRLNLLFAFAMLIIAVYHIILYAKRPSEHENLVFAVLNIVSALYMSVFYLTEIPGLPWKGMSFLWFQKIFSSCLPFLIVLLVPTFVNSFLKRRDHIAVLIIRFVLFAVPVVLSLITPDYVQLRAVRPLLQLLLIPPVIYTLALIITAVAKKKNYAVPLLLGFSPMVLTLLVDLLLHNLLGQYIKGLGDLPYFTAYGWQLVILALLFVLASKSSSAFIQVEDLNQNLEKKVAQRTDELTRANAELEDANRRTARDLKLASFVQQSFYARSVPSVDGWDIALYFKPMSGVSGDLYDFFTRGRTLEGLGLFDVSGHGISSGLVTMLSKTIIDRVFAAESGQPVSKVMADINHELIEAKGDIQNYLTGVLVRIKGDRVEYVNGGHPPIFYRMAKGRVVPVEVPNASDEDSGGIIGMAGIEPEFKGIQFTMKSGDALIMYTDCLSESSGEANPEQFGYQRIMEAFSASGGSSAKQKLESVLSAHAAYMGSTPANDDLTVIVLQKK